MARIFVSSANVDEWPACELIRALQLAGVSVSHSPSAPQVRHDPRWEGWYRDLLPRTVAEADLFVAVVDLAWTCSTWMGEEAHEALRHFASSRVPRLYLWNPSGFDIPLGMRPYAQHPLPHELRDAVQVIVKLVTSLG